MARHWVKSENVPRTYALGNLRSVQPYRFCSTASKSRSVSCSLVRALRWLRIACSSASRRVLTNSLLDSSEQFTTIPSMVSKLSFIFRW